MKQQDTAIKRQPVRLIWALSTTIFRGWTQNGGVFRPGIPLMQSKITIQWNQHLLKDSIQRFIMTTCGEVLSKEGSCF